MHNELNDLVNALTKSEYTKEESILILKEYIQSITDMGADYIDTSNKFIKRINEYYWKFPHGFYGNMVKSTQEDVVEEYEDHYAGC